MNDLPTLYHWLGRDAGPVATEYLSYRQLLREAELPEADHDE